MEISDVKDRKREIFNWIDQHPYDLLVKDNVLLLAKQNLNWVDRMYGQSFIDEVMAKINTLQLIYDN